MKHLEFEEKAQIRKSLEKYCLSKKYEDDLKWWKGPFDIDRFSKLLKGSLDIEKMKEVEKNIQENQYMYPSYGHPERARIFCIGKAIIIMHKSQNTIIKFIPLDDFKTGMAEYMRIVQGKNSSYNKKKIEAKQRLEFLENEFIGLGEGNEIEKGRILDEIDSILLENKEMGKKGEMWKKLEITDDKKSHLCKRYNLFKKFENSEIIEGKEDFRKTIEMMTVATLKEITKEDVSDQEKEKRILEEMLKMKDRS